ncbi:MAG: hypothetical protein PHE24_07005 [Patescibacteria group bacterium]|nr:hypothetical protein [Patescibacteria group bacterium]
MYKFINRKTNNISKEVDAKLASKKESILDLGLASKKDNMREDSKGKIGQRGEYFIKYITGPHGQLGYPKYNLIHFSKVSYSEYCRFGKAAGFLLYETSKNGGASAVYAYGSVDSNQSNIDPSEIYDFPYSVRVIIKKKINPKNGIPLKTIRKIINVSGTIQRRGGILNIAEDAFNEVCNYLDEKKEEESNLYSDRTGVADVAKTDDDLDNFYYSSEVDEFLEDIESFIFAPRTDDLLKREEIQEMVEGFIEKAIINGYLSQKDAIKMDSPEKEEWLKDFYDKIIEKRNDVMHAMGGQDDDLWEI